MSICDCCVFVVYTVAIINVPELKRIAKELYVLVAAGVKKVAIANSSPSRTSNDIENVLFIQSSSATIDCIYFKIAVVYRTRDRTYILPLALFVE
ncbi:MAG: hypothetical protein NVS4B11_19880 [Ktedonobacteraceae bacterium]